MTARIPLSAPDITEAEIAAVSEVLRTPHLSLGPELAAFETELAAYHGVDPAVAVSSGTAGLHLSLLTLGVGEGDEVIIPSFTFVAVVNAVLQVRATPVLVELDPVTLNLDPDAVERAITRNSRAILAVHTFGVPAQMDVLKDLSRRHHLLLIEDASEAIGARFRGGLAGSFGEPRGPRLLSQQTDHNRRGRRCADQGSSARRASTPAQKSGARCQRQLA